MLVICTWWWGEKYPLSYLQRLRAALTRNLKQPHRLLCMTERERRFVLPQGVERHAIKDPALTKFRGCFARLRLFDPGWQHNRGIETGDRVVCLDLDLVITGGLDDVLSRSEPLVVLTGVNMANPCPYNCSIFSFAAGAHPELWQDFARLEWSEHTLYRAIKHYEFPDDQGWLW